MLAVAPSAAAKTSPEGHPNALASLFDSFGPQFILGYLGMPRRYHAYPDEFQVLNVLSSAGANPWLATGLEWKTESPPAPDNFPGTPIVNEGAYEYSKREI